MMKYSVIASILMLAFALPASAASQCDEATMKQVLAGAGAVGAAGASVRAAVAKDVNEARVALAQNNRAACSQHLDQAKSRIK